MKLTINICIETSGFKVIFNYHMIQSFGILVINPQIVLGREKKYCPTTTSVELI